MGPVGSQASVSWWGAEVIHFPTQAVGVLVLGSNCSDLLHAHFVLGCFAHFHLILV